MSDSVTPWTVQPARLLCPRDSPDKNIKSGQPFPSPGNLPDREIKARSSAWRANSSPLEPLGKPIIIAIYNVKDTKIFNIIFFVLSSKSQCAIYMYDTSQFRQVFKSHQNLLATLMDSQALDIQLLDICFHPHSHLIIILQLAQKAYITCLPKALIHKLFMNIKKRKYGESRRNHSLCKSALY